MSQNQFVIGPMPWKERFVAAFGLMFGRPITIQDRAEWPQVYFLPTTIDHRRTPRRARETGNPATEHAEEG